MRTRVTLDDDVAMALEELRRKEGLATSAALSKLVRQGLAVSTGTPKPFRQDTSSMGPPRIPIDNIGEAIELLEGESHR